MSKELIDRLKSYIPSGDGHNSQYANDLADAVELLEAADALEAKAAPVGERDCDRSACGDFSPGPCDNPDCPALRSNKAAPVAYITGQFAGRCIIEPINRAAVLPTGMALYATPQPSAGVVMPERKDEQGAPTVNLHIFREGWNACLDEFARLNGKEVE